VLTDVYGPRLTGSPNLKAAGEWAVRRLESWGLTGGRLEPWNFGRPGGVNERFAAHLVAPSKESLVGEVVAWTPGTNGRVVGRVFQLNLPENATAATLTTYFESVKNQVGGRVVLVDRSEPLPIRLSAAPRRLDEAALREQFDPVRAKATEPAARAGGQTLGPFEISRRLDEFLVAHRALIRVNDAKREHGQIAAFTSPAYDAASAPPTVVLRTEDYGRVSRLAASGTAVELEFEILNRLLPEGRTAYNAIAEFEGTDKRAEIVMLGAHLDSWHSATGATDNAVGCAVMMEAARILAAVGVKPRRTIRVALWGGEEQGLLGSQAYVEQHFGSFENPKPAFFKLAAYFNLDHGTGRPRGATVFGPAEAAAVLREALTPLADVGFVGVVATRERTLGSTDHTSFNRAGLPGVDFHQDPIEYDSHTHHTNLDTFERVLESDLKASAIVVATAVYELAMRDEVLPRFGRAEMP
jgi:hypothetical protein